MMPLHFFRPVRGTRHGSGPLATPSLNFTTEPSTAALGAAITPAVVVTAKFSGGATDTAFAGNVTVAIGSVTGGGTLTGTLTRAAVAGVATFNDLAITTAGGTYDLVVTSPGLIPGTSSTFVITTVSPQVPVLTALTRDVGSASGGTTFDLRGYNLTSDATVTINGVSCTGVTFVNSTRVTVTSPAGTVGAQDVVLTQGGGSSTLTAAFEYLAASSTTFAASAFSGGSPTLSPFTVVGTVALSTDFAEPGGTQSAKCTANGSSSAESSLQITLPANSSTFLTTAGMYFHYYLLVPDSVFSSVTGQIKLSLARVNNAASGEWGHLGIGSQVGSSPVATDGFGLGIVNTPGGANYLPGGHPGLYFRSNRWLEVLIYMKRTSGVNGRIRTWMGVNKMLKKVTLDGSDTDPANGEDTTTDQYEYRVGAVYNQGNVANPLLVYLGQVTYKNGVDI